ncbi:MAG: sigma-70 family RNA polymerase sigma factor [Gemmataceae bacterium]
MDMAHGQLTQVFHTLRRLVGAASDTDADLLERFRKERDEAAFAGLLERHGPLVLNVCRRMLGNPDDADDAFQATFLVLAKKAQTIRRGQSLSSWLYGVACRVSLKARTRAARLRLQERQASEMRSEVDTPPAWNDLRPLLDEELSQLPEKYRLPVVLRYLEGKSHEETARELGWPGGSVSWRLSRALELLRQRLARRGVTLPATALAALLAEQARVHAVSPMLADATLYASMNYLAGQASGNAVSCELARGAIKMMFIDKLKWLSAAAVMLIGVGVVCVLGWQATAHTAFVPVDVGQEREDPVEVAKQIRRLLPEAAAMSARDFVVFEPRSFFARDNQPLTAIFLSGQPRFDADELKFLPQKQIARPEDDRMQWALRRSDRLGYVTFLQPEFIKDVTCKLEHGLATGTATFQAEGVYFGQVDYVARRVRNVGWQIVEFRLPKTGVTTRRRVDDTWAMVEFNHLLFRVTARQTRTQLYPHGFTAEPVELALEFTNTSAEPIRLDAYLPMNRTIKLEVQGPDRGYEVREQERLATPMRPDPKATDYPEIAPGGTYTHVINFPGHLWHLQYCTISKPGEYRLRFKYVQEKLLDNAFAREYWLGGLTAEDVALSVFVPVDGNQNVPTADEAARQIRTLLPAASSLSVAEFKQVMAKLGLQGNVLHEPINQPLTLILVAGGLEQADFKLLGQNPAKLAQAISRSEKQGYGTFLQPDFIDDVTCRLDQGTARGTITFHADNLYEGKVDYVAHHVKNGGWQIDEFRLPRSGFTTRRRPDGSWAIVEFKHLLFQASIKSTETRMAGDGNNAEPVEITLVLENTGDQPIKLDTYMLMDLRVKLEVTGPEGGFHVIQLPVSASPPVLPPQQADFPVLAPGKTFTYKLAFPGAIYKQFAKICALKKPGDYRLRMRYEHTSPSKDKLGADCWIGAVSANDLMLVVKPAGK